MVAARLQLVYINSVRGVNRLWGESSVGRNAHGAKHLWGEMSFHGAMCPWGEMSVGRKVLTPHEEGVLVNCGSAGMHMGIMRETKVREYVVEI